MKLHESACLLALLALSASAFAATTNTFELTTKGKKTATTTFTLEKTKDGLKVHSEIDYVADGAGGVHASDYRVGTDGITDGGSTVNRADQTAVYFKPDIANSKLTFSLIKANKPAGSHDVPLNPQDLIIALPDDPSVWQVVLEVTTAHPHPDKIYRLLVPATATTGDRIEPFRLNSPTDATGTLDGKAIALRHYTLQFNSGISHIYTDTEGHLMQASITVSNTTHTRTNFSLDK